MKYLQLINIICYLSLLQYSLTFSSAIKLSNFIYLLLFDPSPNNLNNTDFYNAWYLENKKVSKYSKLEIYNKENKTHLSC